jgi:hypothetical protein
MCFSKPFKQLIKINIIGLGTAVRGTIAAICGTKQSDVSAEE